MEVEVIRRMVMFSLLIVIIACMISDFHQAFIYFAQHLWSLVGGLIGSIVLGLGWLQYKDRVPEQRRRKHGLVAWVLVALIVTAGSLFIVLDFELLKHCFSLSLGGGLVIVLVPPLLSLLVWMEVTKAKRNAAG